MNSSSIMVKNESLKNRGTKSISISFLKTLSFVLLCFSVLSRLDLLESFYAIIIGGAIFFLVDYFNNKKVTLSLTALTLLFIFIRFDYSINGFKLFANSIFTASQKAQSYNYQFFNVSLTLTAKNAAISYFLIELFCCLGAIIAIAIKKRAAIISLLAFFVAIFVYFGVYIYDYFAAIAVGVLAVVAIIKRFGENKKSFKTALIVFVSIVGLYFIVNQFFSPIASFYDLSEALRDFFAAKGGNGIESGNNTAEIPNLPNESPSGGEELGTLVKNVPILLIVLCVLVATIILFPFFVAFANKLKMNKRLYSIDKKDNEKAAVELFNLSIKKFKKLGYKSDNCGNLEFLSRLKSENEYCFIRFLKAYKVWQKARFLGKVDYYELCEVRAFYVATEELFFKKEGIRYEKT